MNRDEDIDDFLNNEPEVVVDGCDPVHSSLENTRPMIAVAVDNDTAKQPPSMGKQAQTRAAL